VVLQESGVELTKVELRLFGELRGYVQSLKIGEVLAIELCDGATIGELMKDLRIPDEIVKIILVNGRSKGLDYTLIEDDRLALFPPVAGG
jgi:molybdopterin converting factor small subunit